MQAKVFSGLKSDQGNVEVGWVVKHTIFGVTTVREPASERDT